MPKKTINKRTEEFAKEMERASDWLKTNPQYLRDIENTNIHSAEQCAIFKKRWGFAPILGSILPFLELWEVFDNFLKAPHQERSARLNDGLDNSRLINGKIYDPNGNIYDNIGSPPVEISFEIFWYRPVKSILNDIKMSIKQLQILYKVKTHLPISKKEFVVKISPYKNNSKHLPEITTLKVNLSIRINRIIAKLDRPIQQLKNEYNAEERPRHTGLADEYIAFVLLKQGIKTSKIQKELARFDNVELSDDRLKKYLRAILKARRYIPNTYSY